MAGSLFRGRGRRKIRVFTVGHSTRSREELLEILRRHGVELLADVRRFPASRRHPHFSRGQLSQALREVGIDYLWLEPLGGRRSGRRRSPHTAWQTPGFAAYADHMETAEFREAMETLLVRARAEATALLCAEALPQRCHRRLIADWLTARGIEVVHLLDAGRSERHELPPFARLEGERLVYDGGQGRLPSE